MLRVSRHAAPLLLGTRPHAVLRLYSDAASGGARVARCCARSSRSAHARGTPRDAGATATSLPRQAALCACPHATAQPARRRPRRMPRAASGSAAAQRGVLRNPGRRARLSVARFSRPRACCFSPAARPVRSTGGSGIGGWLRKLGRGGGGSRAEEPAAKRSALVEAAPPDAGSGVIVPTARALRHRARTRGPRRSACSRVRELTSSCTLGGLLRAPRVAFCVDRGLIRMRISPCWRCLSRAARSCPASSCPCACGTSGWCAARAVGADARVCTTDNGPLIALSSLYPLACSRVADCGD
jgi:hypothetical protein